MQFPNQSKLPLTANWWKIGENIKTGSRSLDQLESIGKKEKTTITIDDSEEMWNEYKFEKDTTLDSIGMINVSKFVMPSPLSDNKEIYEKLCQKLSCPSSRRFVKILNRISVGSTSKNINMSYYGLTELEFRAIILSDLVQFSTLNLQCNVITEKSLTYLINVLKESQITELNLSCTNIARFGSKVLSSWLTYSKTIKKLYLRNNNFNDNDGILLFEALLTNKSLQVLDLAENNLSTFCGDSIMKMMENNDSLESLDVSWNHLRLEGSSSLSKGLKKNNGLKSLILNWNGFEDMGAYELALSLKDNEYLEVLEIMSNRITDVGFAYFLKALEKNTTLGVLKIGWNTISQDAAEKALESLKSGSLQGCSLNLLDFSNIIFRENFKIVVESIQQIRADFKCIYGYSDGNPKVKSVDPITEALQIIQSYLKQSNINLVDLFEEFDVDNNMIISYDELLTGLKKGGIPITESQINQLIEYLDFDGNGEIDLSELVIGVENHSSKDGHSQNSNKKFGA